MAEGSYMLDAPRREIVLRSIIAVSQQRSWHLLAAHVRTTHVHVVVEADCVPEKVMHAFKAYASKFLNGVGLDAPDRKRWTRHGSTKHLWKPEHVAKALHYVVHDQGEAMAVFEATAP
jgi:REP element-mobilizing transposase RayT